MLADHPLWAQDEQLTLFRDAVARFFDRHAPPGEVQRWRDQGLVSRDMWRKSGDAGLLCMTVGEELGGASCDFRYEVVLIEEMGKRGLEGFGVAVHSCIVAPYLEHFATDEQRRRWLPRAISGDLVLAIAMSEPAAGSDLRGIHTRAVREGSVYVIDGQKTFISNGQSADLIVVACKTGSPRERDGLSLLVVEAAQSPGLRRGRTLKKMGRGAQDTSELFLDAVRVPAENLLGGVEGQGLAQIKQMLPQERLVIAAMGQALMERAFAVTVEYTKERKAFERPLLDFQNTQFKLAESRAQIEAGRALIDRSIVKHLVGQLNEVDAAIVKLWVTEAEWMVVDSCLQLFGGYGYMDEYPISHIFRDSRVDRIHGGTSEIMKSIIARSL